MQEKAINSAQQSPARLGVLVGCAMILCGLAVVATYRVQLGRQAERWLQSADQLERQGADASSAESLQRYVRLRPDDAVATRRLADLRRRVAQSAVDKRQALALYEAVLQLDAADVDAQARRAQLLLELGQAPAALQASQRVLLCSPNHPVAQRTHALALLAQPPSGSDDRLPRLAAAIASNPGDYSLVLAMAKICCQQAPDRSSSDDVDSVGEMLASLVRQFPDRSEVWFLRYVYRKHRHMPEADDDLQQTLRLGGDQEHAAVLLAAGGRSLEHRRWATAGHYYRRAAAMAPSNFRAHLGLGLSYRGQQRLREAYAACENGLQSVQGPDRLHLYYALAEVSLHGSRPRDAQGWLERSQLALRTFAARIDKVTAARLHLLAAEMEAAAGNDRRALGEYKTFLEALPDHGDSELRAIAYRQVAQCYARLQRWDLAAVHYGASARQRPCSATLLQEAICWERIGSYEQAIEAYRSAVRQGTEAAALRALLNLLSRTGRLDEADAYAAAMRAQPGGESMLAAWHVDEALERARWRRRLWRPLALFLAGHGQVDAALRLCLTQPSEMQTADDAVVLATLLSLSAAGDSSTSAARARLESLSQRHDANVELLAAMGTLHLTQDRLAEARCCFQRALLQHPYHVQTLNNMALMLAQQPGEAQKALVYIDEAILSAGPQEELLDTRRQVAEALAGDDYSDAVATDPAPPGRGAS